MTPLPNNYFAVQVPRKSRNIRMAESHTTGLPFIRWDVGSDSCDDIVLPPGSYTIVGLASSITEEQAGEIVEQKKDEYGWYWFNYEVNYSICPNAIESFRSLVKSKSLELSATLIIKTNQ